jgi:hypothetical protein
LIINKTLAYWSGWLVFLSVIVPENVWAKEAEDAKSTTNNKFLIAVMIQCKKVALLTIANHSFIFLKH